MVWPLNCEDGEHNKNLERIMNEMGIKFFTIIDPRCPVQGGSFFWLAPNISPQQIQALYKQAASGVRTIEDNPPLEFVETNEGPTWTRAPTNHRKRRNYPNLSKRARVNVVRLNSDQDLAFLSTGPKMKNSEVYSYFPEAGAGVRVYVLGSGFDYVSEEFSDRSISWIFGDDVSPQRETLLLIRPVGRLLVVVVVVILVVNQNIPTRAPVLPQKFSANME